MENFFEMNLTPAEVHAVSNLGLAHIGDGVYELLCRSYLIAKGGSNVGSLHRDTIALVRANHQAILADKLMPLLTEDELAYYRRGKNAHVHAVPKSCSKLEYCKATGLEALFGALYLLGERNRANALFIAAMEDNHGV